MEPKTKEHIFRMTKKNPEHYWSRYIKKKRDEKNARCSSFLPESKIKKENLKKEKEQK